MAYCIYAGIYCKWWDQHSMKCTKYGELGLCPLMYKADP